MKISKIGKDIITVDETNYNIFTSNKIHIIKLDFKSPDFNKLKAIFKNYFKTNRFIIQDNIRIYNNLLKNVNKKYYVMNVNTPLISFFKKNNKVVLNTYNLKDHEKAFVDNSYVLIDILNNIEVIITDKKFFEKYEKIFMSWSGNVILSKINEI